MSNPPRRVGLGLPRPRPKAQVQDESQQPRLPSAAFTSPVMMSESLQSNASSSTSLPRVHPESEDSESVLFNSLPPLVPGHVAYRTLHPEKADLPVIMESNDRDKEVAPRTDEPEAAEDDVEEEQVKTPPPPKRQSPTWSTQQIPEVEEPPKDDTPEVESEEIDLDELDSQDLSEGDVPTPADSLPDSPQKADEQHVLTPKRTAKTTPAKASSVDSPLLPLTHHPIPSPSKSRVGVSPMKALSQPSLISPGTAAPATTSAKKAEAAPTLPAASPSQDDDHEDDDNDSMLQGMEYRRKEKPIVLLDRLVNSSRTVPRDDKTPEAETEESCSQHTSKTKSTNTSFDSRRAPVDGTFLNPLEGTFLNETALEGNGSLHIGGARVANPPLANYRAVTPPPHLAYPCGDPTYVSPNRQSLTYVSPSRAATAPTYVSPVRPSDAPSGPPQPFSSKMMPASTPPSSASVTAAAIMSSATELEENEDAVEEDEGLVMEENVNGEPRRRFGGLLSPGGTQVPTSDTGLLDSQSQGHLFGGSQTQLEGAEDFAATQLQVAPAPRPPRSESHLTSNIPVGRRLSRRPTAHSHAQISRPESPEQGIPGSDMSNMGPSSSVPSGGIHEPTEDTLERAVVPSRPKPSKTYGSSPTKRGRRGLPSPAARCVRSDDHSSSSGAEDVRDGTYKQPAETVTDIPFESDVVEETPATPPAAAPPPPPATATKPANKSVTQVRVQNKIPSSGLSRASSRSSRKRKAESPPPERAGGPSRPKRGKERAKSPTPAASVVSDPQSRSRAMSGTANTRSPTPAPAPMSAATTPSRVKRGQAKATALGSPSPAPEPQQAAPTTSRAKRGKAKATSPEPQPAAPAKPRAKKAAAPRVSSTRPDRGKRKVMSPSPSLSGSSSSAPEDVEDYTYRPVKKLKTGATTAVKKEPARAKSPSTSARARSTSGRSNRAASTAASTRSSRAASTATGNADEDENEDDGPTRVLALWKHTSAYYAGTVTGRNTTGYAVKFDDGHTSTQPLEKLRYLHFNVGDTVMGKTVATEYHGEGDLLCIDEKGKQSKIKSKSIVILSAAVEEHFDDRKVPAEVLVKRFPPESNGDVFAGKVFVLTAAETPNVAAVEDMKKRIEAHGGTVSQTWEELFDCSTARLLDNTLPPFLISLDNPVITTPKVLAALATGIPILAPRYVADAIKDPETDWRSYLVALESKWLQVPASQVIDPFWGEGSWNASTAKSIRRPLEGRNIVFIEVSNKLDKRRRENIKALVPFCLTGLGATVDVERAVPADTSGFDLVMVEDRDPGLPRKVLKKHREKLVNVAWMKSCLVVGKALPTELASD